MPTFQCSISLTDRFWVYEHVVSLSMSEQFPFGPFLSLFVVSYCALRLAVIATVYGILRSVALNFTDEIL